MLFLGGNFQWSVCRAGEIFMPVDRGSRSLEVPLLEVRQYVYASDVYNTAASITLLHVVGIYIKCPGYVIVL